MPRFKGLYSRCLSILFLSTVIIWLCFKISDQESLTSTVLIQPTPQQDLEKNKIPIKHENVTQDDSHRAERVEPQHPTTEVQQSTEKSILIEHYKLMESYKNEDNIPRKKILFWNDAYGGKTFDIGLGKNVFREAGCPVWQCETTDNRASPESYDAVVFHQRSWYTSDLPKKRSPHQRYVFWSRESPGWRLVNTDHMAGFFNWTISYRWDSDIVFPYSWFSPINESYVPMKPDADTLKRLKAETASPGSVNYAKNKTKLAAWFVSNCDNHSARDEFVKFLKTFIEVDVYGQCGDYECPRSNEEGCRLMLKREYKFYMALENTLCADYVTEKFYGHIKYNVIPVVFDLHGHHSRFAPPHSFINAADFPSVRELADYLILLDKNDTLYNEYFWWKKHYINHDTLPEEKLAMCHMCALLNQNPAPPVKVYHDMTEWWDTQAKCQTLEFHPSTITKDASYSWKAVPMLFKHY